MRVTPLALALVPLLAGCGESGQRAAHVVEAAAKDAVEAGKELADQAAELARLAPEEARTRLQGLIDASARQLAALRDSETARKVVAEIERLLAKLIELKDQLGSKLDLAGLQTSAGELVQRFKQDPRVAAALANLQERLDSLTR
jgi:uncharacterized protein YicC (UPF0701 family)